MEHPHTSNRESARFPHTGTPADRLRFAVSQARLAPSSHNAQPWLFRLGVGAVDLFADRTRALPVVDPDDRELVLSCGAALHHLRTALCAIGDQTQVHLLPDELDPDLLATVTLRGRHNADPHAFQLLDAISKRHTARVAFESRRPDQETLALLARVCKDEGAHLDFLEGESSRALAELVAEADRIQLADPAFRRELSRWVHSNRSRKRDGIPGYAHGMGRLRSTLGPLVIRTFDIGDGQAARDRDLLRHSPVLAVLSTDDDSTLARLEAGVALSALLLEATVHGLSASFLNQPLEVRELRPRVAELLPGPGRPAQLVLRLGYTRHELRATPRRELSDVLL